MGGLTWQPSDVTSVSLIVDYLDRDATPNTAAIPAAAAMTAACSWESRLQLSQRRADDRERDRGT